MKDIGIIYRSLAKRFFAPALILLVLAGCNALPDGLSISAATQEPLPTIVLDDFTPATGGAAPSQGEASGVIASGVMVPAEEAEMAFSIGGNVEAVNVAVGDRVEAGQLLIQLSGREKLVAAVESANLELLGAMQGLDELQKNLPDEQTEALEAVTSAREEVRDAERVLHSLNTPAEDIDVEAAWATVVLAGDKLDKAREDYQPYENKSEENLIRAGLLNKLAEAQAIYDDAVRRYNNLAGITGSEFDRSQAEARLSIAQSRLALAQQEYEELLNGPDPDQVALAEARIQNAQAQIEASQSAMADLELKAPFTGTVGRLNIHSGEWVIPGQPVIVLADLGNLRAETTDLSERDIPKVEIGQPVTVFLEALNQTVTGRVSEISPLADTLGGDVVYSTKIDLDTITPGLRAGMSVEVQFGTSQ
jgi:multidrug efflux pump subunit AcrA (membrane-fusion protein)